MIYLDASVLVSLYYSDSNSTTAVDLVGHTDQALAITPLSELETLNAFSLSLFRRNLTHIEAARIGEAFQSDLEGNFYQLYPFPDGAFARAKALSERITPIVGVRAADLLHIAAALEIGAKAFYTFDLRQNRAAEAAALLVNQIPS